MHLGRWPMQEQLFHTPLNHNYHFNAWPNKLNLHIQYWKLLWFWCLLPGCLDLERKNHYVLHSDAKLKKYRYIICCSLYHLISLGIKILSWGSFNVKIYDFQEWCLKDQPVTGQWVHKKNILTRLFFGVPMGYQKFLTWLTIYSCALVTQLSRPKIPTTKGRWVLKT